MLHLEDAVGSQVTALLGRGLPRDYIDVAASLSRFSRARLLELAFERDPGLRMDDVAFAMVRLDRLGDEPFQLYGLRPEDVNILRHRFDAATRTLRVARAPPTALPSHDRQGEVAVIDTGPDADRRGAVRGPPDTRSHRPPTECRTSARR